MSLSKPCSTLLTGLLGTGNGLSERQTEANHENRQEEEQRFPKDSQSCQQTKQYRGQRPLRHQQEVPQCTVGRCVHNLEESRSPDTVVDTRLCQGQGVISSRPVDAPAPDSVPETAVFLRPLPLQQGFCPTVIQLLLPVGPHRPATVVPDHGARAETEFPPPGLDPPADIHVIPGDAESGVEPANLHQRRLAEGHVAAGDVFRLVVREHDMNRSTWRDGNAIRHEPVPRMDVGPTDPDVIRPQETVSQEFEPVEVRAGIRIDVCHNLTTRGVEADVPGPAQASFLGANVPDIVPLHNLRRSVNRAVIDDDHLIVGVVEPGQAFQSVVDR